MIKYLIRIDDICDNFIGIENYYKIMSILKKNNIIPLVGVIPKCNDETIIGSKQFKIETLKNTQNITVALHGFEHKYSTKESGLLKLNNYSEFAGETYEEQFIKIKKGKEILEKKLKIKIWIFFAPAHSFDLNTLKALEKNKIYYISDGISLNVIKKNKMFLIPQQKWNFKDETEDGLYTLLLHPQNLKEKDLKEFDEFINRNKNKIFNYTKKEIENYINKENKIRNFSNKSFITKFYIKRKLFKFKNEISKFRRILTRQNT